MAVLVLPLLFPSTPTITSAKLYFYLVIGSYGAGVVVRINNIFYFILPSRLSYLSFFSSFFALFGRAQRL